MFWRYSMSNDPERTSKRKAFLALMLVPGSTFTAMGPGGSIITLDTEEFEEVLKVMSLITEIESVTQFTSILSLSSSLAGIVFHDGTEEQIAAVSGVLEGFAEAMGQKRVGLEDELADL